MFKVYSSEGWNARRRGNNCDLVKKMARAAKGEAQGDSIGDAVFFRLLGGEIGFINAKIVELGRKWSQDFVII